MTGLLPGLATEADRRAAETDKRDREDDPTPRELVRAILAAAMPFVMAEISEDDRGLGLDLDALDVCAGYGCWASELRRWCVRQQLEVMITGVEICEARRVHLRKWCDEVVIGDWFDALRDHHELPRFDVAMGNPHFSALVGKRDREPSEVADMLADPLDPALSMPAVLLEHTPAVLLFHQTTSFQRGRAGVAAWRVYPPARVWLVPGSVGFRGPGTATDSRCYQASLWLRGHKGPTLTEMLPSPPDGGASWRWTVPPGSEEPSDDMPGVVRGDS